MKLIQMKLGLNHQPHYAQFEFKGEKYGFEFRNTKEELTYFNLVYSTSDCDFHTMEKCFECLENELF